METPKNFTKSRGSQSIFHFCIGLLLSLTLVITAFEWNFKKVETKVIELPSSQLVFFPPEMTSVNLPPPPKPLIRNENEIEQTDEPIDEKKIIENLPSIPLTDYGTGPDIEALLAGEKPTKEITEKPRYELIPAEPIEGKEKFERYLYEKVNYPYHLISSKKTGRVVVKFKVSENGELTNFQIISGFDAALEREIIRVLKSAPAWRPAHIGNRNVGTWHVIPFSFDLR